MAVIESPASASESNYCSQNVGVFELVGIWIEIGFRFGLGFTISGSGSGSGRVAILLPGWAGEC